LDQRKEEEKKRRKRMRTWAQNKKSLALLHLSNRQLYLARN